MAEMGSVNSKNPKILPLGLVLLLLAVISFPLLFTVWLISCIARGFVLLFTRNNPSYGKLLGYFDACMDDGFEGSPRPKSTIVTTITLEGNTLSLDNLCQLFTKLVLEATLSSGKQRYPEFKQYLTTLLGIRVWKNDPTFMLEEHVKEKLVAELELASIIEEFMNAPYRPQKSPWEMVLIRQHKDKDRTPRCILALRLQHSMADAKSILNVVVESLGRKRMTTAVPAKAKEETFSKLLFHLMLPVKLPFFVIKTFQYVVKGRSHPWNTDLEDDMVPVVVGVSTKLSLRAVKQLAKQHGVRASSLMVGLIAGAISKYEPRNQEIFSFFPQPKEKHPEGLCNHFYIGCHEIPTISTASFPMTSAAVRVQQCHQRLQEMRQQQWDKFVNMACFLNGIWFNFLRNTMGRQRCAVISITNNAGELEGFSVGGLQCSQHTLSVGPFNGSVGVMFSVFSYQETIQVILVAKESVVSGKMAKLIAEEIGKEFEALQNAQLAF